MVFTLFLACSAPPDAAPAAVADAAPVAVAAPAADAVAAPAADAVAAPAADAVAAPAADADAVAAPDADAAPVPVPAPAPSPGHFLDREVSDILSTLRTARFESARELGGISLSFKVKLAGGTKCSFKPEIRGQRQRWQGEVAAWRISRLLGLDADVPPSESRRIRQGELLRVLENDERTTAARERLVRDVPWDDAGTAPGAVTFWIPDAAPRALERETAWKAWLQPGTPIADADRALATQISNLFVFDHVIGNWDRLSGGGFLATRDGARLFFIDHNAGFYRPMPREAHERLDEHFRLVRRFGRGLLGRLRALDAVAIRGALGEDGGGLPILTDEQIADVLVRRDEVISAADALVREHGEAAVLAFE